VKSVSVGRCRSQLLLVALLSYLYTGRWLVLMRCNTRCPETLSACYRFDKKGYLRELISVILDTDWWFFWYGVD